MIVVKISVLLIWENLSCEFFWMYIFVKVILLGVVRNLNFLFFLILVWVVEVNIILVFLVIMSWWIFIIRFLKVYLVFKRVKFDGNIIFVLWFIL